MLLLHTTYHKVCWYCLALANYANNKIGCFCELSPTGNWNAVNSDMTSFPAPQSHFRGKWNAPKDPTVGVHTKIFHITSIGVTQLNNQCNFLPHSFPYRRHLSGSICFGTPSRSNLFGYRDIDNALQLFCPMHILEHVYLNKFNLVQLIFFSQNWSC